LIGATLTVFVPVKDAMLLPLPLAPMPMFVLLLLHAKVVVATSLTKLIVVVGNVLHTVCPTGVTVATGVGFTLTENV
jgi:hypothetical protein